MSKFIIPGLRLQHILILGTCAYLIQAIATADGAFKLNHSLALQVKDRGYAGVMQSLGWMDTSADAIDRWSAKQFGKDPWLAQTDFLSRQTADCVTTPSYGKGYLSKSQISLFHRSPKKDIESLGSPLCKSVSGRLRYLTDEPQTFFEVDSANPKNYGAVTQPDD